MKQIPIKLGPLALLLTVICICLTTLAVLAFATARADQRLAAKSAETVSTRYQLEIQGQEFMKELSETDPADYSLMDLERIGFRPSAAGHVRIVSWRMEKDWAEDDSLGDLWDGGFSP